jgi:hypothetical protein
MTQPKQPPEPFCFCPLNEKQRARLRQQIDSGPWKNSWHLPSDSYGHTNWHTLETLTQIRDVLIQQRAEATAQLREVEACMHFTVYAMIEMEKERDQLAAEALEAKND